QNYPNPFNPETTIHFDLSEGTAVTLTVYDAAGQSVRNLVNGEFMAAGTYNLRWDGRNADGGQVGSGIYFYELKAGSFTSMKKMTLLQ
ncbi:MAG: FlgD immunoglobulin-like domain containing protein, partial [Gemmatimonadota bacterium]